MDALLEHLLKEWQVILQAPFAFLIGFIGLAVIIFFAVEWLHKERVATKDERIKLLSERLDESRMSLQATAKAAMQSLANTSYITLHTYGDDRHPIRLAYENVWRWYTLRAIGTDKDTEGTNPLATILFISFEIPVSVGTLEISSPDMQLPLHETKEFNNRFAIIVFNGSIPQGTLRIEVHQ